MTKNVTLRLDEAILHKARHQAVEKKKSLSQWLSELIAKTVAGKGDYQRTRERALKRLQKEFHLGGKSFKREEIYDRQVLH